jgi:transcriptional regulator with XRE-family HTH domain
LCSVGIDEREDQLSSPSTQLPRREVATRTRQLGLLLKQWRRLRGKSQLALALDAGVSPRHLSFIESGRSQASREFLLALADALDVPLRERNLLLAAAGFAAMYPETALTAEDDATPFRVVRILDIRSRTPRWCWTASGMVQTNRAAPTVRALHRSRPVRTAEPVAHVMFNPAGMRPWTN